MLFYLSKDKIKLNAQEIASFLIQELHQSSLEKVEKVKETIEKMHQLIHEEEKRIAAFEFKKVQDKEREQTKSLHNKEIEACNTALSFSKRLKKTNQNENTLTLHSKLASRVEELIKFKTDLARKNMIKEHGENYDPKTEATKFIDFSFAQGGKNLPGRLTMAKQVERANRHAHIAHQIVEFKKQGMKYSVKKPLPDKSKITYSALSNNVIKELNEDIKVREKLQIFLTDDCRNSQDKKIHSYRSYHSSQSRDRQVLTTRSLIENKKVSDRKELHSLSYDLPNSERGRESKSFGRNLVSNISRTDRASKAISKKLKMIKDIASVNSKDINLEGINTAETTRMGSFLPVSPASREYSNLPSAERSKRGVPNPFLTTEGWLPKPKVT